MASQLAIYSANRRLYLLGHPLFIASIVLLLINDFILKASFHNWFTGKLSDIAGLLSLTLFGCALWPRRALAIGVTVTGGFILWKSPYSQFLIDFLNHVQPFTIGRTVDYSDYFALPVIWLTCRYFSNLHVWPTRTWLVTLFAIVSFFAFAATSYIPLHTISMSATLPLSDRQEIETMGTDLQNMFDHIAETHGLYCIVCDPLKDGRLYVKSKDSPADFSLSANIDPTNAIVFFNVQSVGPMAQKNTQEIDSLQLEIENDLRTRFPNLMISKAKYSREKGIQLGVWKKNSESYKSVQNQSDYIKALAIIDSVLSNVGMKHSTAATDSRTVYYTGRLYGPYPSDHELVVDVSIADAPLVSISIDCYSVKYLDLQKTIAHDLESALEKEFGKDRVGPWTFWRLF